MLTALLFACQPEADPDLPVDCAPATREDVLVRKGDYYRCLDAALAEGRGCGAEGYPLGYGGKYADRYFDVVYPEVSPDGQRFITEVSVHLQEEMAAWVTRASSCEEVWERGFDSHPLCYIDSGFCDLWIEDVVAIVAAVDPEDQELPDAKAQTEQIIEGCP